MAGDQQPYQRQLAAESGTSPRLGFEPLGESLAKKISTKIASPSAVNASTVTMSGAEDHPGPTTEASGSQGISCQECEDAEPAAMFCKQCNLRLCRECGAAHMKQLRTRMHEIVEREQPPAEEDPDRAEIEIVKAKTMHQMVNYVNDYTGESKKLIYLSNFQASLVSTSHDYVEKLLSAFEIDQCKLVIRFLPTSGGSDSISRGMLKTFASLPKDDKEKYAEAWREMLRTQVLHNPKTGREGLDQDQLPFPAFLDLDHQTSGEASNEAEWGLECFMRDVLIPIAAETKALVIGSAFSSDALMMMFCKVADSVDAKYGGVGAAPWHLFGFADAPSLQMACCDSDSVAYSFYKSCPKWQERYPSILTAKLISKMRRMGKLEDRNHDGKIDEEDLQSKEFEELEKNPFDDTKDVMIDINPNIKNLVIVGGVDFNKSGAKRSVSKVNRGPQLMLEAVCMDWLISNLQCIGIASLHANGGYKGLSRVVNWLNLQVPTLLLDVRKRDSYSAKKRLDALTAKARNDNRATLATKDSNSDSSPDSEKAASGSANKTNEQVELWEALFTEVKEKDYKFFQDMLSQRKVDLLEVCRLSHLHTILAPKSRVVFSEGLTLHSAIQKAHAETLDVGDDKEGAFVWNDHAEAVTEYLLETEFRGYWEMKPSSEKAELAKNGIVDVSPPPSGLSWELIGATRPTEGNQLSNDSLENALRKKVEFSQDEWNEFKITELRDIDFIKSGEQYFRPVSSEVQQAWRIYFKDQIKEARAIVHAVLTHDLTYSCHVGQLDELNLLINHQMMDKGGLQGSANLEGLLILRSAWDIVDIATHVIRGYKLCAKVLHLFIILLGIVHPCVVVFSKEIDAALTVSLAGGDSMVGSQFIIFIVSTIAAFVTAINAFYNPLRRWQQIRDAEASMQSAIWQFRTRTGPYAMTRSGDHTAANVALREQETSFYKQYSSKIFIHGQRPTGSTESGANGARNNKVSPQDQAASKVNADAQGGEARKDTVVLDIESLETRDYVGAADNHHSPLKPDEYIRHRIFSMVEFYRKRLPKYSAFWERCQFVIMSAAVISATISYLGFHPQVAIVAAATAGISGYNEWTNLRHKIARYNSSIVALENLILWWDSMTTVEQATVRNIESLISQGEAIINAERGAWLSSSASDDDKKKNEEKGATSASSEGKGKTA